MCDTLGVLTDSYALFGKNSDRSPNEAQLTEYSPARIHDEEEVACTYRLIPQARETLGVLLSRPSWMWGAEIGVNEAGVAIGNEAVFTKGKYGAPSLTGMDLLRLALERAESAERAVNVIIELLELYGQGGNCGYDHQFYYDNSFLVIDQSRLFVLETSQKNWVVKSYRRVSISNRLSIGADGERYGGGVCDFAKKHSDPLYTFFSGSRRRQGQSACALPSVQSEGDMARALRTHDDGVTNPFAEGSVSSCCMHYGGMVGDHSTASMIVRLDGGAPTVFLTGTSTPCVSLYKPYRFGNPVRLPVISPGDEAGLRYWHEAERFRRALIGKTVPAEFYAGRDALEKRWMADVSADAQAMDELLVRALREEAAFYASYDPGMFQKAPVRRAFMKRWDKKNAALTPPQGTGGAGA
ncbi:MAG: peptidase U34 [Clostridiales bacterium]|nr:peptidase U34 [Clostridiales bacterium]